MAASETGRVIPCCDATTACFDTDQAHGWIVDERVEDAHGVTAAADAGDDQIRQAPDTIENVGARLLADDRLELPHHQRIRVGTDADPSE